MGVLLIVQQTVAIVCSADKGGNRTLCCCLSTPQKSDGHVLHYSAVQPSYKVTANLLQLRACSRLHVTLLPLA